jgi:hypothetical protein
MIHSTKDINNLVIYRFLFELDPVNDLRSEVVLVLNDVPAALAVPVAAHREDLAGIGQRQSVSAT